MDKKFFDLNQQEQIIYNANNINRILEGTEAIGRFGIQVVGKVQTKDLIPLATEYQGEYGDAYAVGVEEPYYYYVFTRPFAGETNNQWFPLGQFPAPGPQGEQGIQGDIGPQGERGSLWFSSATSPTTTDGFRVGDYILLRDFNLGGEGEPGSIYHLHEESDVRTWIYEGNIRGPQGLRGLKGDKGDKGDQGEPGLQGPQGIGAAIVQIVGERISGEPLPDVNSVLRTSAYIEKIGDIYHLWVIVGTPGNYQWVDSGPLSAGTIITKNGSPLTSWDVSRVLEGPFGKHWTEGGLDVNEPMSGLLYQEYVLGGVSYGIKVPEVALGDVGPLGRLSNVIAAHDKFGKIGAIATNRIPQMQVKNVPTDIGPSVSIGETLPLDYATPRAYVDAQIQYAGQEKISWPASIPQMGMLLGINSDKTVQAIDPATIAGDLVKVDCQVVKRGGSLTLPRDRMYLIRGYGENTCTLKNNQGGVIAANFTMAFGAVSSSHVEISDPTKTWAGFMYISNTSSYIPSINWNGNSHQEVIVYNNDTGTSGSGNLYVYSIGASN